ncbi:MAG: hypothetical protein GY794_13890 [bacterium]|nr:hypothetical protein [bacterium]
MEVPALIIDQLGKLAQGVSAVDRWKGMQTITKTGRNPNVLWWVLVSLGTLAVMGIIAGVIYAYVQKHRKWQRFKTIGLNAGLRDKDMLLLERVARLVRLKNPSSMLSDEDIYNAAALGLMSTEQITNASEEVQKGLQASFSSIRRKLGLGVLSTDEATDEFRSSRQIKEGSRVFVSRMGARESVEATIARNSRSELLITATETFPGRRDNDILMIRYANDQGSWEFDARVIRCDGPSVAVEHSPEMRPVNFRRFPRVPTEMSAAGVVFPFHVDMDSETALEFLPASIVEIAGPGLLIKLPAQVGIGQKLLIRVVLDDGKLIQGMMKVRRIVHNKSGGPFFAVEFMELAPDELAEMARATILAAKRTTPESSEVEMAVV